MDYSDQQEIWLSQQWLRGGSALPLMRFHVERDQKEKAIIVGRTALSDPDCADAEEVAALLSTLESTPAGWDAAIDGFVADPSSERWENILRFAPPDLAHAWLRRAYRDAIARGCDPNALVRFGSQSGVTPDVMELVDQGGVDPETLIERANQPGAARSFWLGLAAQAAYLHGNKFRAVSLLREAKSCADDLSFPLYSILFLQEREDPELEQMMQSAGVWEIE